MNITKSQLIDELRKQKDNLEILIEQAERADLRKKLSQNRWLTDREMGTYIGTNEFISDFLSLSEHEIPKRVINGQIYYDRLAIEKVIKSKPYRYEEAYDYLQWTYDYLNR